MLPSASEQVADIIDPSTGRLSCSIPAGAGADVNHAVSAARAAFEDGRWSDLPPSVRKGVLHRYADLIAAEAGALDALDAGEMGKPLREAFCNAAAAAGLMRFYAEAVDKVAGDVYASDRTSLVLQRRVPRGVVGAITPWNFPTFNAVLKIAPALAAGNCVVLKPSELCSSSAMRLMRLAAEAGMPAGALNMVPGLGESVGRALAMHRDVDMITFTGSTAVGKSVLQSAGQSNMKVVTTECGGKSPQIVFADGVDLDAAAETIARGVVTNQGQVCSAGTRLLVQREIEATLLEKIVRRLKHLVIGNALNPSTTFGPLASAKQCARVMRYIEGAGPEGAELVCGGNRVLQDSGGFFVEPTVFRRVSPRARLAQEEIFGPVLSVTCFDDEAQAAHLANDSAYALIAYVWTADLATGMRMMKAVRSSVIINGSAPTGEGAGHALSSEPARESGLGAEGGLPGLESYFRRQLAWFNHA